MKPTRISVFALLVAQMLVAQAGMARESKESRSVRRFVQSFYDWYTPMAFSENRHGPCWYIALQQKGSLLNPSLLQALQEDVAAQKKSRDDLEGLDYDPFMLSQDPDPRYLAKRITKKGAFYYVYMHRVLEKSRKVAECAVIAQVENSKGHWRFNNFIDPQNGWDLRGSLKELKKGRLQETPIPPKSKKHG